MPNTKQTSLDICDRSWYFTLMSKQKVFVGLSGGVDSSVAALRLLKEGYDVVGVFIKVWQPDFLVCNWEQERLDAMRVAAHLGIPFLTCDAEKAYKKEVGEYFIQEYITGRTPNPDVMCNQHVKFGAFLKFALERGADYIATGHYAQKVTTGTGQFQLHRGIDTDKDQSYFLWTLSEAQLTKVLLPVGNSTKSVIRKEAKDAGIPTATKKDSQGVCFLGPVDIPEFIGHFTDLKVGDVLNTKGEVIGSHKGVLVYTLGQRHGFHITTDNDSQSPYYVVDKNLADNTITVSGEVVLHTPSEKICLANVNWITEQTTQTTCEAQFRYRQKPFNIKFKNTSVSSLDIYTATKIAMPALGQSCVLYRNEHCLGGGIITECQFK